MDLTNNILDEYRENMDTYRSMKDDIEDIINHTSHKQSGIGGIDTRGVARKIYPTRG